MVLYSRTNCHLCEAFEEELKNFLQTTEMACEKIDIDGRQALQNKYGNDVPVLMFNDEVICQHFFDQDKIIKVLS
ncbi:MAG: glutaredoxin family protein [Gammaproteobacteria bacterium]|nr:glutaredoxin family protein [Gammaproteobacteria bacterium]